MALPPAPNPMPQEGSRPPSVPPPPLTVGAPPLPGAALPPGAPMPAAVPLPGGPAVLPPGQPDVPVAEGEYVPPLTFFQLPWVQNALPIVVSVVFHLGIIIIMYVLVS